MDKPEFRVERGPAATDEPFAVGMAKLLEREGRTIAAAEMRRLHAVNQGLLEALKELDEKPEHTSSWLRARAAIAKAEGEQP
jgi:hypothetical protein